MKRLAKYFISRISFSSTVFRTFEKIYFYSTGVRFRHLKRTDLEMLSLLVRPSMEFVEPELTRVGSEYDGGYLMIPPRTTDAEVISLGVGDNLDFEISLIQRNFSNSVLCFDGSIEELPEKKSGIFFESKFVKSFPGDNCVTLQEITNRLKADEKILKIDIEGDEWSVLETLNETTLSDFSQIIGEFHGIASCTTQEGLDQRIKVLKKLHNHFFLINAHPNNWSTYRVVKGVPLVDVIELTFVSKKWNFISKKLNHAKQPNIFNSLLNSPCNPDLDEYLLH